MLSNIFFILLTLFGVIGFLLLPGTFWINGMSVILLGWVLSLFMTIPKKSAKTRGRWAFIACFVILVGVVTSATLLYLQANSISIEFRNEILSPIGYVGTRIFATFVGALVGLMITLIFFGAVGYFSSIYVLALHEEELTFWNAFKSFMLLISNKQLAWLLIENGKIIEIKKQGFTNAWLSRGKIIIKPGNAVVLERGGKITGIYGPGIVTTVKDEYIRQVFDLRPQYTPQELENAITADGIPLKMSLGISYKLKPFLDSGDGNGAPKVIKESNFGLFPILEETLRKAAFNNTTGGWTGFAVGAVTNNLRDQIMAHSLNELFEFSESDQASADGNNEQDNDQALARVNERKIKVIEDAVKDTVNGFADNFGVEITSVDISQITLPDDIKEAIHMRIKSHAEAEAIDRKSRAEAEAIKKIEGERNSARGELISKILDSIAEKTDQIGAVELQLATVFAQISRRALTDDILGHQYVEMLKALAEGDAAKIFNATPGASIIEPEHIPIPINSPAPANGQGNENQK